MAAEFIFYAILIYLVYKLVFGLIVPVSQVSRQMKQQFRDIHSHAEDQANDFNRQQNPGREYTTSSSDRPKAKRPSDDYIDFEEVK